MKKLVFALAGIMLAALVIAMAFHLVIRARSTTSSGACIFNLALIEGAKQQWAAEHPETNNVALTWNDIRPYMRDAKGGLPFKCPSGGVYTIGRVGEHPRCSIGGPNHSLPDAK